MRRNQKAREAVWGTSLNQDSVGNRVLSHSVSRAVPSALVSLTTGFGMGPGGPSPLSSPTHLTERCITHCLSRCRHHNELNMDVTSLLLRVWSVLSPTISSSSQRSLLCLHTTARSSVSPQSPRPLVRVSCNHYWPSTSRLSNWWSPSGLTSFQNGVSHLEASFPLRCFQRLSLPKVATRLCRWHDNRHTSASSTPVLSY